MVAEVSKNGDVDTEKTCEEHDPCCRHMASRPNETGPIRPELEGVPHVPLLTKLMRSLSDDPREKSTTDKRAVATFGNVPGDRGEGYTRALHRHLTDNTKKVVD